MKSLHLLSAFPLMFVASVFVASGASGEAEVPRMRIHLPTQVVDLEYETTCWVTSYQDTVRGCGWNTPVTWKNCAEGWLSIDQVLLVRQEIAPFGCIPWTGERRLLYLELSGGSTHAFSLLVVGIGGTEVGTGEHREFMFDSLLFAEKVTVTPVVPLNWGPLKSMYGRD